MHSGVETAEFFLFYYNKKCAYYVPKRALSDDDVLAVRRQMLQELGVRADVVAG